MKAWEKFSNRVNFLFFSSPDKWITSISLGVGFLSLFIDVLAYKSSIPPDWYLVARDWSLIITFVLIIMALSIKYFKKDKMVEDFRDLVLEQVEANHLLIHGFRDLYYWDLRHDFINKTTLDLEQLNKLKREYTENVCRSVMTKVRESFLRYYNARGMKVGQEFAVTVKFFFTAEEAQGVVDVVKGIHTEVLDKHMNYMMTAFRDDYTWANSGRTERMEFPYAISKDNTAFDEVVNLGNNHFLSNNLQKDFSENKYHNQNPNWIKNYNATLVVPIRYRRQSDHRGTIVHGVIAVDSKNSKNYDLFDKNHTLYLLAGAADLLAVMFGNFDVIQHAYQLSTGKQSNTRKTI